ncbi:peptidoglycan-binding protein [Gordonia sihwensis]|nr:peptidoglycan-binding protein [Gordonia sihwensis]
MFDAPPAGRTALSPSVYRRRRWAGAAVVGGTLAGMVWLLALVGAGYQDAATPESPAATHVVYVRSGESLTALAERIAPELPSAGVIAQLRDLNGLETSGLHVGQALIAPQYG